MKIHESYHEIWKLLDDSGQRRAATVFLENTDEHPELIRELHCDLATVLKFRPESLAKLSITKRADHLGRRLKEKKLHGYLGAVLADYLLSDQEEMLSTFLNALGIEHDAGRIEGTPDPPSLEALVKAIPAIGEKYRANEVQIYLSTIYLHDGSELWGELPAALEGLEPEVSGRSAEVPDSTEELELDDVEEGPESSEVFTTLDNWLIRASVATAAGEIGAMSEDELFDLVEELTALNADRRRSYFHRGFFDALFDRDFTFSFRGENAERRAWYLRGVMLGLLRGDRRNDCLEIIRKQSALVREVAEGTTTPCGAELLPLIYSILMDGEQYTLCREWISRQIHRLRISSRIGLLIAIYEDAADLVRSRRSAEAILLLEILVPRLRKDPELPPDFVEFYEPRSRRKLAQAHQGQGNFTLAEKQFEDLAKNPDLHLEGAVLTDLGLIRAGLRGLSDVTPRNTPERNTALCEALEKGDEFFVEAVERYGERAINAHLVLGILGTLQGADAAEATVTHLQQARTGMIADQEAYENGDLLAWAAACLGLALLESADSASYQRAADLTRQALDSEVIIPLELWERFLRASVLFDDTTLATEVAERLLDLRGDEACIPIRSSGVLEASEGLRTRFMELRRSSRIPADEMWADWRAVLLGAMEGQSWDQAEITLDHLEELGQSHSSLRSEFVQLLEGRKSWSPVWDEEDVENVLARFHELDGHNAEACDIFHRRFFKRKTGGAPHQLEEATQLLERIRSLGNKHIDLKALASQLQLARDTGEDVEQICHAESWLSDGNSVSLIYIGGNETQAQHESAITERLQDDWPGVEVEFHFPGWGSHWATLLETLKPRIVDADAVVLSYLVRTNCGRHIRKLCVETPWFACTGKGRKSIEGSLRQAALWSAGSENGE